MLYHKYSTGTKLKVNSGKASITRIEYQQAFEEGKEWMLQTHPMVDFERNEEAYINDLKDRYLDWSTYDHTITDKELAYIDGALSSLRSMTEKIEGLRMAIDEIDGFRDDWVKISNRLTGLSMCEKLEFRSDIKTMIHEFIDRGCYRSGYIRVFGFLIKKGLIKVSHKGRPKDNYSSELRNYTRLFDPNTPSLMHWRGIISFNKNVRDKQTRSLLIKWRQYFYDKHKLL